MSSGAGAGAGTGTGAGAGARGAAGEDQRGVCSACRGTGRVISGLGGTPHEVTCPWCGGDGVFKPGRDAQEGEKPSR